MVKKISHSLVVLCIVCLVIFPLLLACRGEPINYTGKIVSSGYSTVSNRTDIYFQDGTHLRFSQNTTLSVGKTYRLTYMPGLDAYDLYSVQEIVENQ